MNKNELIATKKDIIIFFIIPIIHTIILLIEWIGYETRIKEIIKETPYLLFFFIPPILAVLLNLIFKLANIKNEKIIKITKIIFFPFAFLFLLLVGAKIVIYVPSIQI